jgi:hypothetical protein
MTSKEVEEAVIAIRKAHELPLAGIASSNIRRQLLRLKEAFLIQKQGNSYCVSKDESLLMIFEEKIESYYLSSILKRVKDYIREVDNVYSR